MSQVLRSIRPLFGTLSRDAYVAASWRAPGLTHARFLNTDNHGGEDTEEFIEHYLSKAKKADPSQPPPMTSRREALALYRAILRNSRLFVHQDERGNMWRDTLREAARKEFDVGKLETDPEMVTKLIISGRDYMEQAVEKFMAKREQIIREDEEKIRRGQLPKYRADDPDY
mmetsp:Transcript_2883/g.6014  ORF Transcript_2883/g.6014 Transcript_2883/m.6014 type:complete len:171 (-) Transcript_2883:117-629(-)